MGDNVLKMYTVYDHPTDFPDEYVVREWLIDGKVSSKPIPGRIYFKHTDLSVVRNKMAGLGLVSLHRNDGDDPCILMTYI